MQNLRNNRSISQLERIQDACASLVHRSNRVLKDSQDFFLADQTSLKRPQGMLSFLLHLNTFFGDDMEAAQSVQKLHGSQQLPFHFDWQKLSHAMSMKSPKSQLGSGNLKYGKPPVA